MGWFCVFLLLCLFRLSGALPLLSHPDSDLEYLLLDHVPRELLGEHDSQSPTPLQATYQLGNKIYALAYSGETGCLVVSMTGR